MTLKHVDPAEFLHQALSSLNMPYIWGAKGYLSWTITGPRSTYDVFGINAAMDCSGLVTSSLFAAGGNDLRFTHNTDKLREDLPVPPEVLKDDINIVFFPGHVGIVYRLAGRLFIVEAAGGDHTTLSPAEATRRSARVRVSKYNLTTRPALAWRSVP